MGDIRLDIRKTEWGRVDRILLAQDRDYWWALVNNAIIS
jgi:hypothetical protein